MLLKHFLIGCIFAFHHQFESADYVKFAVFNNDSNSRLHTIGIEIIEYLITIIENAHDFIDMPEETLWQSAPSSIRCVHPKWLLKTL